MVITDGHSPWIHFCNSMVKAATEAWSSLVLPCWHNKRDAMELMALHSCASPCSNTRTHTCTHTHTHTHTNPLQLCSGQADSPLLQHELEMQTTWTCDSNNEGHHVKCCDVYFMSVSVHVCVCDLYMCVSVSLCFVIWLNSGNTFMFCPDGVTTSATLLR